MAQDLIAVPREAFHYTLRRHLRAIMREGLLEGSYATTVGVLTPLQALLDLALSPERDLPEVVLRIDLAGLRQAGLELPPIVQVARKFNLPGGGYEMMFPYEIEPLFLSVVKE